MENRVTYDSKGHLDEIVTDGGGHLEHLGGKSWFLNFVRADGSSVAVWIRGKVTEIEERPAPTCRACGLGIPANAPTDECWLKCPACGWSTRPEKNGIEMEPHSNSENAS